MNINYLKDFVILAKHNNYLEAAEELFIRKRVGRKAFYPNY